MHLALRSTSINRRMLLHSRVRNLLHSRLKSRCASRSSPYISSLFSLRCNNRYSSPRRSLCNNPYSSPFNSNLFSPLSLSLRHNPRPFSTLSQNRL